MKINKKQFVDKVDKIVDPNIFNDKLKFKTVLITAGHGYGNVGDEAQLHSVLLKYKKFTEVNNFILLSPNPKLSKKIHKDYQFDFAARISIFNSNWSNNYKKFNQYTLNSILKYLSLLVRFRLSIFFVKNSINILLLNQAECLLLNQVSRSSLIHISGGGFITGTTRSRLLDSALLMKISQWMEVPYILTGQSISNLSKLDKFILKNSIKKANLLTFRDGGLSQEVINKMGLKNLQYKTTSDEAVIINKLDPIKKPFKKISGDDGPYAIFQYHDWNISKKEEKIIFDRLSMISKFLKNKGINTKIISMTPSDINCAYRLQQKLGPENCENVNYSINYKTNMIEIRNASLVITMKHHPIIFAQACKVPVIALSFHPYSFQKNKGALINTKDEKYNVNFDDFKAPFLLEEKINIALEKSKSENKIRSKYLNEQFKSEEFLYRNKIQKLL